MPGDLWGNFESEYGSVSSKSIKTITDAESNYFETTFNSDCNNFVRGGGRGIRRYRFTSSTDYHAIVDLHPGVLFIGEHGGDYQKWWRKDPLPVRRSSSWETLEIFQLLLEVGKLLPNYVWHLADSPLSWPGLDCDANNIKISLPRARVKLLQNDPK